MKWPFCRFIVHKLDVRVSDSAWTTRLRVEKGQIAGYEADFVVRAYSMIAMIEFVRSLSWSRLEVICGTSILTSAKSDGFPCRARPVYHQSLAAGVVVNNVDVERGQMASAVGLYQASYRLESEWR